MADNPKITKEQVEKIAVLTKLDVSEKDSEKLAEMFSHTLDVINVLGELDTAKVSETYQITGLKNVFQKGEENQRTLTKKEVLMNAKETSDGLIVTKGVFNR